jgi:hypothetical protein|tara:strand:- start:1434 stop:1595 length:162 start_codon:yes stop_codon:yes gene_type:complete
MEEGQGKNKNKNRPFRNKRETKERDKILKNMSTNFQGAYDSDDVMSVTSVALI